MSELLIATKNAGKAREFAQMLPNYHVKTLADLPSVPKIVENGSTFTQNALNKAQTLTDALGCVVVADDSGLCVDALGGKPGIHSARYAGDHDDEANNKKLLKNLADVPTAKRTAHFHCTIVATAPQTEPLIVHGDVFGRILPQAAGEGGFGYDPLFYYPPFQKSFGQVSPEKKNQVSHRAKALAAFLAEFESWQQQRGKEL